MKRVLAFTVVISIIVVSFSIAYYFLVFLPQKQKSNIELQNQIIKLQQEVSETRESIESVGNNTSTNTDELQYQLEDLQNSIQEQQWENDHESNCESNGGRYMGGGMCIYE